MKKLSKKEQRLIKKYPNLFNNPLFTNEKTFDYRIVNGTPMWAVTLKGDKIPRVALQEDGVFWDVLFDNSSIKVGATNKLYVSVDDLISSNLDTTTKNVIEAINYVYTIAQGTQYSYVIELANNHDFISTNETITATQIVDINGNTIPSSSIQVGASVYNTDRAVPDRWYAGNNTFYAMYQEKIDLTEYQKKEDNTLATTSKLVVGAINENRQSIITEAGARGQADSDLQDNIDAIIPVIKTIIAHQTINTYEVPTLSVQDVTDLYNSIVAGRTTIIHFNPSNLGVTTDYTITQATNIDEIGIRFVFNDSMILTYTIEDESVVITFRNLEQPHLYRHRIYIDILGSTPYVDYYIIFDYYNNSQEQIIFTDINQIITFLTNNNYTSITKRLQCITNGHTITTSYLSGNEINGIYVDNDTIKIVLNEIVLVSEKYYLITISSNLITFGTYTIEQSTDTVQQIF